MKTIQTTIKHGRKEYEIKKGDYIIFNGSVHQFMAGDGRTLTGSGFDRMSSFRLSKTALAKIPLDSMETKVNNTLQYWYF